MGFGSILKEKLKGMVNNSSFGFNANPDPPELQYGERVTQDKRLIALRRQRNRQMDIVERERLEASIKTFERRKASSDFMGKSIITGSAAKRKPSFKSKNLGFLGKGGL